MRVLRSGGDIVGQVADQDAVLSKKQHRKNIFRTQQATFHPHSWKENVPFGPAIARLWWQWQTQRAKVEKDAKWQKKYRHSRKPKMTQNRHSKKPKITQSRRMRILRRK